MDAAVVGRDLLDDFVEDLHRLIVLLLLLEAGDLAEHGVVPAGHFGVPVRAWR